MENTKFPQFLPVSSQTWKEEKRTLHWQIKNNTVARKKGERETHRAWISQSEGLVAAQAMKKSRLNSKSDDVESDREVGLYYTCFMKI
jgi:hypothetical protein